MTMKNYIGVKSLEAKPMNLGDYNTYRGWPIPADEDPQRPGYLVRYADGYESWSPKEAFEAAYFPIDQANKLAPLDIDNFLGDKLDTLKSSLLLKKSGAVFGIASASCCNGRAMA